MAQSFNASFFFFDRSERGVWDVLVMNGDKVQASVLSVDVSDEFRDLTFEFRRVGQRGRRDLDQDDLDERENRQYAPSYQSILLTLPRH